MDVLTIKEATEIAGCSNNTIIRWMTEKAYFKYSTRFKGVRKYYEIDKKTFLKFWEKKKKEIGKI